MILRLKYAFDTFTALQLCTDVQGDVDAWFQFSECDILTEITNRLREVSVVINIFLKHAFKARFLL